MYPHYFFGAPSRSSGRPASLFVAILITSFLLSAVLNGNAQAASFTLVSDMISNSSPGVSTNHAIAWTSASAVGAGLTIKIGFDPAGDQFNLTNVVVGDVSATGMTVVANLGACSLSASEVYPTIDSTAPDENVTLTVCPTDTVGAGAKTVTIGNNHITNPAAVGSYRIVVDGTQADRGETRVAIINNVAMSAQVDTSLTFTVSGLGVGQSINVMEPSPRRRQQALQSHSGRCLPIPPLLPDRSSQSQQMLAAGSLLLSERTKISHLAQRTSIHSLTARKQPPLSYGSPQV